MKFFSDISLSYKIYNNTYLQPFFDDCSGGMLDERCRFIQESSCYEWNRGANLPNQNTIVRHKKAIFIGTLIPHWGHTYTDNLRRIWFLKTEECQKLMQNGYEIVYLTLRSTKPLPSYVDVMFSYLGIDLSRCRHVVQSEKFDSLVLPDSCFLLEPVKELLNEYSDGVRLWTKEFAEMIAEIKENVPKQIDKTYSKIYLSRTYIKDRRDFGEAKLESFFSRLGYKIIHPETLPISDQISLISSCDEIVATEGTVAHNAIFAREQTKLIILKKADYNNSYQNAINEVANLKVVEINCHHSSWCHPSWPYLGPFYMCITPDLEQYFGTRSLHIPFIFDPIFWKYCSVGMYQSFKRCWNNRLRRS